MYFAYGQQCHVYSVVDDKLIVQPVTALHSDHEDADTKMLLHAAHTLQSCSAVTIQSDDTDVFMLCVGMKSSLKGKLYLQRGTGCKSRTISTDSVVAWSVSVCACVLVMTISPTKTAEPTQMSFQVCTCGAHRTTNYIGPRSPSAQGAILGGACSLLVLPLLQACLGSSVG